MEYILGQFRSISSDALNWASEWKTRTHRKVIGCFPMYVPEEIIHAAGALPITLQGSHQAMHKGADQLPFACHLIRGNLGLAETGELDFIDGIVFTDICDAMKWMPDFWPKRPSANWYQLGISGKVDSPTARKYIEQRFTGLKRYIEQLVDTEITDDAISESITIYERNRELLDRLYQLRRANPTLIKASDLAAIVSSSMIMPKQEHNLMLDQLLDQISTKDASSDSNVRVVLSGCLCDFPDEELLDIIESQGISVVDDDIYVGARYFADKVKKNCHSPIEGLAERYIEGIPCATKVSQTDLWADYLINITNRAQAKGIIILKLKFCEVHAFDIPRLESRLKAAGVPSLLLELEPPLAKERIRTRLQAFAEQLQEA